MNQVAAKLTGPETSFNAFGVAGIKPNHPAIQQLRERGYHPTYFGNRIWRSSYLLVSFLDRSQRSPDVTSEPSIPLRPGLTTLELGAGWGLISTYLNRLHSSRATAMDIDPLVVPYQQLLADINGARVTSYSRSFSRLAPAKLAQFELVVGADICYNHSLRRDLMQVIENVTRENSTSILLADRGREPFMQLCEWATRCHSGRVCSWQTALPTHAEGYILRVGPGGDNEKYKK